MRPERRTVGLIIVGIAFVARFSRELWDEILGFVIGWAHRGGSITSAIASVCYITTLSCCSAAIIITDEYF
jgi:hypothetical protein